MRASRLNDIEKYILDHGTVSWDDLKKEFQMSTNTLRRDINELLERENIHKVYGGIAANSEGGLIPVNIRSGTKPLEKQKIGELASTFVNDHQTVFLDSGTTVPYIVSHLAKKTDITIITHSLKVMCEAAQYPSLKVIAIGGYYNDSTSSYAGISTFDILSHISTDAVFIAATGISLTRGLTHTTYFEAETKRKIVHCSDKIILMADDSKFDRTSTITFCKIEDLYGIVTNCQPPEEYLKLIEENDIQLLY